MSKKLASGAQAMVLDVKVGLGAFMQTLDDARALARLMVDIAHLANRTAVAPISDMNQPLGFAVGNSLEIQEAIETLQGGGPADFREHCLEIASQMLKLGGITPDLPAARRRATGALSNGEGWERFRALVAAQGGDISYLDEPTKFPSAPIIERITAPRKGYISSIHARIVGETAVTLGGGRAKKGDTIDHAVGIILHHKVGDFLEAGEPLVTIHANSQTSLNDARTSLLEAHTWSHDPVDPLPLFYEVVE